MKLVQMLVVPAVLSIASIAAVAAFAQTPAEPVKPAATRTDASKNMTEGEIRKVDKDTGKLTIKHGEIENLSMPAMTMVFQVKEKAMLDKVKTGDKVRFVVINDNGKMIVTDLQPDK